MNFVLIFLLINIEKYLKLVAGFTFNSFSLRLANNNRLPFPVFQASLGNRIKEKWHEICVIFFFLAVSEKGLGYEISLCKFKKKIQLARQRIKKISNPGKGTRFGKHLFITYVKIEYTLCIKTCCDLSVRKVLTHVRVFPRMP